MEKNNVTALVDITAQIDETSQELYQLIGSLSEEQFNMVPFIDSWTPAQLAVHVTKSNNGIA